MMIPGFHTKGFLRLGTVLALLGWLEVFFSAGHHQPTSTQPLVPAADLFDQIPREVSMYFAGDMMGHIPMINAARVAGNGIYHYSPWFQHITNHVSGYDLAIANLEVTLAGAPYTGYPQFCSPDAFATAIQEAGFDFLLTANNHAVDRGNEGIIRTIQVLDSLQLMHTGTFISQEERDSTYPLIWERHGARFAFLNCTYGTNGLEAEAPVLVNLTDTTEIYTDIRQAKQRGADIIIMTIHWGEEYQQTQNAQQEELAQWLADQGVDAIIGMHPHVVQPMRIIYPTENPDKMVPVAFSMGNFVSNQRWRYCDGGIAVELHFSIQGGQATWTDWGFIPYWVRLGGDPRGYYIIPVSHWESDPEHFGLNDREAAQITQFAADTREWLEGNREVVPDW